jgi:hypothetical protein
VSPSLALPGEMLRMMYAIFPEQSLAGSDGLTSVGYLFQLLALFGYDSGC